MSYSPSLIHFKPNLRSEKAHASTGYTWGKPADVSNIVAILKKSGSSETQLGIETTDRVAERWLCSDDQALGSVTLAGKPFFELLQENPEEMLGEAHVAAHGAYLKTIMKQLDTHADPKKGSLSVQVHPRPGHPSRPAKPEMWKGTGALYLGWNKAVTLAEITAAYESGTFEKLMNALELSPEKLVLVKGGMIHAIRYNTFTAEWSMAPGAEDIKKGNLKDATVSPYDRTDGKTPRPGKENLEATLELLSLYSDGFAQTTAAELFTEPHMLDQQPGGVATALFRTPEVSVNQIDVATEYLWNLAGRGLPAYVETGQIEVFCDGQKIDQLQAGEEVFIPAACRSILLRAEQASTLYSWCAPLTYSSSKING